MEYLNNNDALGKYKPIIEEYEYCCTVIKKIEEEFSEQYNKKENGNHKCYLIEKKDFENFKEQINYETFINKIGEYRNNMVIKIITLESENKEVKLEKLKNTILKSFKDLNDLLKEKHEFVLINAKSSNEIIENKGKGEYFCFFSFNSSELIITIEEESLHFHLNKNIINIDNLKDKEFFNSSEISNNSEFDGIDRGYLISKNVIDNNFDDDNLMNLINWIEKFYLLEKEFKYSLIKKVENDKQKKFGYLIEIKAFNEWKNDLNYDSIKPILDKYLKEGKLYLTKEEKEEIKRLLKDQEIKKNKIESLNFKSMEELKQYNRINDLILISRELFILINENEEKLNEIEYNIVSDKKLELIIDTEKNSFNTLENIIYSYISYNLYLLTKIFIFQNDLFKEKKPVTIYLFNKDYLQKYKDIFNYKVLWKIFGNSKLTNKKNEKEIYEFIEKISDSYISSIKEKIIKLDSIKFEKENFNLTEIKSNQNIDFGYIKEFDKTLFDGTVVKFNIFNSIPKDYLFRVKIIFIKEKLL